MKIAVISDIHANAVALDAVYNSEPFQKADKVIVCGDLIGYYYWPDQVLRTIQSDDRFICIRGNHEDNLKKAIELEEDAIFYRGKYGSGFDFCKRLLSQNQIEWLLDLPQELKLEFDGVDFYCGHGTPGNTEEYLYPDAGQSKILGSYSDTKFTCLGHTHYPFLHAHDGQYLLNPGSVGQPRDIGGLASYALVDTDNLSVQLLRVPFDVSPVIEASSLNDPTLAYLGDVMGRGRSQ